MGGTSSKAVTNNMMNTSLKILNRAVQDCAQTFASLEQRISFENIEGNIDISRIRMGQYVDIDVNCIQSLEFSNKLEADLKSQLKSIAETVSSSLKLDLGSVSSESIVAQTIDLAETITNEFTQKCGSSISQLQSFSFKNVKGNVTFNFVEMQQVATAVTSCVTNSTAVNDIKAKLETTIDNVSKTTVEGILGGMVGTLLLIGAVILVIVMAPMFGGMKLLTNKWFLLFISFLISAIAAVIFFLGMWPFDKKKETYKFIC